MSKKSCGSYVRPTSYQKKRKRFLKRKLKEGSLDCYICGQTDLTTKCMEEPDIPAYRKATIDHVIPACKYEGSYLDTNNWKVACLKCNQEKSVYDRIAKTKP